MTSGRLLAFARRGQAAKAAAGAVTSATPSGVRTLTVSTEDGFGQFSIPEHLALELIAGGLVHECELHGLHLNPWRLWTTDDVERLLVAAQSK